MNSAFMKRAAFCATAMSVVLTTPAFAQESAATDEGAIVVTARRVEERLQDVPISITVFNQDQISKRNIVNSADLAVYTPSLSVNSRYGPEKASFAIRGFVQDLATAPSVGVYFADVVAPRSGGATTSGEGAGVGALFDLQNVQVLKGPQGTLFGRNTTGGAVLLVPQKPTDSLEGYVEGSAGDYDMLRFQGVLNVPLSDTFKVRVGVDRMKRDGYLKNNSGIGPKDFNDTNYIAARVSVLAELTPDLENYTVVNFTDSDTNGTVPRVIACNPNSGFAFFACGMVDRQDARGDGWWDIESNVKDPVNHFTTWQVINTTTWQASDSLTVKNIASYGEFKEYARQNIGGENFIYPDIPSVFGPLAGTQFLQLIILNYLPGSQNTNQSTFTEELQFQGETQDGKLKWQAGGYMEMSNPIGYSTQFTPFLLNCTDAASFQCGAGISPTSSSISTPWQKRWFRSYAMYAQGTYDLTDQLAVTAGARYTWDKQSYEYDGVGIFFPAANTPAWACNNPLRSPLIVNGVNTGQVKPIAPYDFQECFSKDTAKSDKPTWTISLEYKPTLDTLLFAKWTRGYRAGGVNPTYVPYNLWGPEKVDTYEIGGKASFRGAVHGYFNLTGFYNDFSNQQIQAQLVARAGAPLLGGTAILNAGKSRIWGIEADGSVTLFDSLNIQGGYTYLNTKLQELVDIPADITTPWVAGETPWARVIPTALVGESLALSPKHRLTLTGTYTLPLDESIGAIKVGATWVYTAKQTASHADDAIWAAYQADPTLIQFSDVASMRNPGQIPATNLLNLNASWENVLDNPVDISFFMTNVTNEKYPLNMSGYFNSFGYESQIVNAPRMWGFRLKYRFGE